MADNAAPNTDPNTGGDGGETDDLPPTEQVVLSKEEYKELIKEITGAKLRVSELEQLEEHVREATKQAVEAPKRNAPQQRIDLDQLSRAQLAQLIHKNVVEQVTSQLFQPIVETVMTLAVKDEIRDVRSKHSEDFDDYMADIQKLCEQDPQLTVEKAYKLAKADGPPKQRKEAADTKTKYPARPYGEKGGVNRETVQKDEKLSIRDSATKAMADLLKDMPDD